MDLVKLKNSSGYSLFELVVVIMIIGVIAAVSMKSMNQIHDTTRVVETKSELDMLSYAICGNQDLISNGKRIDFGYVGDIGNLPPNLAALVTNPGGYATWNGPYINDKFYASVGGGESEYAYDAWGKAYNYSAGITISSSGGSSSITRELAGSLSELLANSLSLTVKDIDYSPPGSIYKDSIKFRLTYPNGSGNVTTTEKYPDANGFVQFNAIPIGKQTLRTIYLPTGDTLRQDVIINPGQTGYLEININEDYW